MHCYNCGATVPDSAEFCGKCGSKLTKIQQNNFNDFNGDETVRITPTPRTQPQNPLQFNHPVNQAPVNGNFNQQPPNPNYNNLNIMQNNNGFTDIKPTPPANNVKKKGKGSKTVILILVAGILAAILAGIIAFGITMFIGTADNKDADKLQAEADEIFSVEADDVYKDLIMSDPLTYFADYQKKSYYIVSNNPDADLRIFKSYLDTSPIKQTLVPDELIYVQGIENGWVCFTYGTPKDRFDFFWCKEESVFKSSLTPADTSAKYNDPISYFSNQSDAYYRVYGTGSDGLNLRTRDNTDSTVTRILQETEIVLVYGIEDGWAYVVTADDRTAKGSAGWCSVEFLKYYLPY